MQMADPMSKDKTNNLFPHQLNALKWMIKKEYGQGGFLCDEQGLGKTRTVAALIKRAFHIETNGDGDRPYTLIIASSTLLDNWENELNWMKIKSVRYHRSSKNSNDFKYILNNYMREFNLNRENGPFVVLTTIETLNSTRKRKKDTDLFAFRWRRVVCDEAHFFTNSESEQVNTFQCVKRDITWLISGTPIQNSVSDFLNLLKLVTTTDKEVKRNLKMAELSKRNEVKTECFRQIRDKYLLRREVKDITDIKLPILEHEIVFVQLSDSEKREYLEYERIFGCVQSLKLFVGLRRLCNHPICVNPKETIRQYLEGKLHMKPTMSQKIKKIIESVELILSIKPNSLENDGDEQKIAEPNKILIFSEWTDVLDVLEYFLKLRNILSLRFDGTVGENTRMKNLKKFAEPNSPQILLINLHAGGVGLNLQCANYVIIVEPYWNKSTEDQAITRSYRIGQKRKVTVLHFITDQVFGMNSIDQYVQSLQDKKTLHSSVFFGNRTAKKPLPQLSLNYKNICENLDFKVYFEGGKLFFNNKTRGEEERKESNVQESWKKNNIEDEKTHKFDTIKNNDEEKTEKEKKRHLDEDKIKLCDENEFVCDNFKKLKTLEPSQDFVTLEISKDKPFARVTEKDIRISTNKHSSLHRNLCTHKWATIKEDDVYRYKLCEICSRKSKENRHASVKGYKESNPFKKRDINEWISNEPFITGKAFILDATEMKTANALIFSNRFDVTNIIVPEYDQNIFDQNSNHVQFGSCMRNGDFLEILKQQNIRDMSLIYADFCGRYSTFVEPLFQYIEMCCELIRPGTVLGITWSDNGAGTKTERAKNFINIGIFMNKTRFIEIDNSAVNECGYGDGGHMNVKFMRKL